MSGLYLTPRRLTGIVLSTGFEFLFVRAPRTRLAVPLRTTRGRAARVQHARLPDPRPAGPRRRSLRLAPPPSRPSRRSRVRAAEPHSNAMARTTCASWLHVAGKQSAIKKTRSHAPSSIGMARPSAMSLSSPSQPPEEAAHRPYLLGRRGLVPFCAHHAHQERGCKLYRISI